MRKVAIFGWLLVPLLGGAYHYGPGQELMLLDDVSRSLALADARAAAGNWQLAVETYDQALSRLPSDKVDVTRKVRVERAKAEMMNGQLPESAVDLKALVEEMQADSSAEPKVLTEARSALANSQYYMTWLMKLEGLPREEWEPEIEGSRQAYRLLAEQAEKAGDQDTAAKRKEDVESAIRLALMDPGDLQGMPIPKQCQGCKSGQCKKPGRKPNGKQPKDARGAGSGPPPDDSGS